MRHILLSISYSRPHRSDWSFGPSFRPVGLRGSASLMVFQGKMPLFILYLLSSPWIFILLLVASHCSHLCTFMDKYNKYVSRDCTIGRRASDWRHRSAIAASAKASAEEVEADEEKGEPEGMASSPADISQFIHTPFYWYKFKQRQQLDVGSPCTNVTATYAFKLDRPVDIIRASGFMAVRRTCTSFARSWGRKGWQVRMGPTFSWFSSPTRRNRYMSSCST